MRAFSDTSGRWWIRPIFFSVIPHLMRDPEYLLFFLDPRVKPEDDSYNKYPQSSCGWTKKTTRVRGKNAVLRFVGGRT